MSAYSKGMRQKILLSAALLHNPSIVILDEPCSGLDVGATLVIRSLIQRLAATRPHRHLQLARARDGRARLQRGADPARGTRRRARRDRARSAQQVNAASLEDAFRTLVFTTDVDAVAGEIVDAISH